ncbi:hypothetical protein [Senegalimassilia faecalis]|uniref:hypothetical protein n=1 Tax=Senegalimassilia faecalis TaxID=2509433 RepID=UPI003A97AA6F
MAWWKPKRISANNRDLNEFLYNFVLHCPSSIEKKEKTGKGKNGKVIYKSRYDAVSACECSFKRRGITGHILSTLLAQLRRQMISIGTYRKIKSSESVEATVEEIRRNAKAHDKEFDLLVFQDRNDMSETEAIYYYIRNAFAHGSFEIKQTKSGAIYYLESAKNGQIKSQMRLKTQTLKKFANLMNMTPDQIIALRKSK